MGRYFPDLPSRQIAQMGDVDDNPVHLTAEEEFWTIVKVAFLWGRSNGTSGEHPLGLALDFSVLEYGGGVNDPGPARMWMGNRIANWLWANRKRLGVWYVIWDGKIISSNRYSYAYGRWVPYRGSNPHTDHVHSSHYAANIYQPPAPPTPEKDWFDMADPTDLRKVVDASLDAKLGPAVDAGIERKRPRIVGGVLNTRFATGVEQLDSKAGGGGRHIPWFLRDLRFKTYAILDALVLLAEHLDGTSGELKAKLEALAAEVDELPDEIAELLVLEGEVVQTKEIES